MSILSLYLSISAIADINFSLVSQLSKTDFIFSTACNLYCSKEEETTDTI